ncbi:hypothetical protein MPSEU_000826500 [Mayamaea pseudoterrestris]|nr:hypothetical protein MPSEU_000826500 [Mayamaea pseudoterrestris]
MSSLSEKQRVLSLVLRYMSSNHRHVSAQQQNSRLQHGAAIRAASSSTIEPIVSKEENNSRSRRRSKYSPSETAAYSDGWVPTAYRGAETSSSSSSKSYASGNGSAARPHRHSRHSRGRTFKPTYSKEQEKLEQYIAKRQEHYEKLSRHWEGTLARLVDKYSSSFGQVNRTQSASSKIGKNKSHAAEVTRLGQELERMFAAVHPSSLHDHSMDVTTIGNSEDSFRNLCRALQGTIESCAALAKSSSAVDAAAAELQGDNVNAPQHQYAEDARAYVQLAEQALLALAKFRSDRAELIAVVVDHESAAAASSHGDTETDIAHSQSSANKGFFQTLVSFIRGDSGNEVNSSIKENPLTARRFAHEDANLGVTEELLGLVLRSLYSLVAEVPKDGFVFSNHAHSAQKQPHDLHQVADRMCNLLDVMPPSWKCTNGETLDLVLDMLRRVGSLESAINSSQLFQQHSNLENQGTFALVLQAYLAACLQETDDEIRFKVAKIALTVLHEQWSECYPEHHVQRVLHASIMLHCVTVADRVRAPGTETFMRQQGENLIFRTLGKKMHAKLMQELETTSPSLTYLSLPLANYLAQLYAHSDDRDKLVVAMRTVGPILSHYRVRIGKMIAFPVVETVNVVLRSVTRQYQGVAKKKWKNLKPDEDVKFAMKVLDDMLRHQDSTCWPDADTFDVIFSLLLAVKPADIGLQADHLLAKMEIRNILSPSIPVPITLSTYHQVLQFWLEAAKRGTAPDACDRALDILNKLELQSNPLLLSDIESRMPVALPLYNIFLRPTRHTYKLILEICLATKAEEKLEGALQIASEAYARMENSGIMSDKKNATLLAKIRNHGVADKGDETTNISSETFDMLNNVKQDAM